MDMHFCYYLNFYILWNLILSILFCDYSHFHLDHCGALPYFSEMCGYDGPIYMTHPTKAICPILLVSNCKYITLLVCISLEIKLFHFDLQMMLAITWISLCGIF